MRFRFCAVIVLLLGGFGAAFTNADAGKQGEPGTDGSTGKSGEALNKYYVIIKLTNTASEKATFEQLAEKPLPSIKPFTVSPGTIVVGKWTIISRTKPKAIRFQAVRPETETETGIPGLMVNRKLFIDVQPQLTKQITNVKITDESLKTYYVVIKLTNTALEHATFQQLAENPLPSIKPLTVKQDDIVQVTWTIMSRTQPKAIRFQAVRPETETKTGIPGLMVNGKLSIDVQPQLTKQTTNVKITKQAP